MANAEAKAAAVSPVTTASSHMLEVNRRIRDRSSRNSAAAASGWKAMKARSAQIGRMMGAGPPLVRA